MLQIYHDALLDQANSLGLPGRADHLLDADTLEDYRQALALARRYDWPLTILGGGSNVVLAPELPGAVLRSVAHRRWIESFDEGRRALLHVNAGVPWPALVRETTAAGWWGLENLALIPGSAGAAPIQNIGAYGVELSDIVERVHCLEIDSGRYRILDHADCAFGYRDSIFKKERAGELFIVHLELRLSRYAVPRLDYGHLRQRLDELYGSMAPTSAQVAEAVTSLRRERLPDPALLGNAGSFFKNPVVDRARFESLGRLYSNMPHYPTSDGRVKLAAGWLIEQCGFRGYRDGPVGVHDHQALVLVHHGGGSASELMTLAERIRDAVREQFGVMLEPEPRLVGF
ncbi:UDP-N-acetylmuramate dehydrogenase [Kushneria phosphatilytica]|uniref:UDP-N-acetylenolpyruvoylglucosamine reductase n=1 Tax=Kushneria phosphatilytica TaxID=657387 RepID=A0A1S1NYW6_9GAMM|nr:UDP-N-acetylmuramate dehydrogenase [Kushneria phosphatilytica]OHV13087.1 UDP-N-acetylenolpyruvoylglucosamine reductase [Kushneria phosphatilytica]QEL10959.1 UDP-N-acetylmuramate dehydrogenase [Kushneria phosphatilytica]